VELTNEFDVEVPIDEAYDILTDLELIAPCLPGAQLQEIEGDEYRGVVKVKVGPITAQYKGSATFLEQDRANHKAVVKGDGRETRGQGNASAIISMTMDSNSPNSTHVMVHTDLTITGKVAQFGRGVIVDVSAKLLGQFVDNLETKVLAGRDSSDADSSDADSSDDDSGAGDAVAAGTAATAAAATGAGAAASSGAGAGAETTTGSETPAAATSTDAGASSNGARADDGVRKINMPEAEPVDLLDTAGSTVLKRAVPAGLVAFFVLLVLRRVLGSSDD